MPRIKGQKVFNNDGLSKRCGCPRKRWSSCEHPWQFSFGWMNQGYACNLNKRAGLKKGEPLSRTEAEHWRDTFRTAIRNGEWDAPSTPADVSPAGPLTVREAGEKMVEDYRNDPTRRAHRIPALKTALGTVCRTVVNGQPFGDRLLASVRAADLFAFRDARRRILRDRDRAQRERRERIASGEIAPQDVKATTELPRARGGEVGLNRQMELLRGLFNFCIKRDLLHQENPFRKFGQAVVTMSKETPRKRRLQGDEEKRLLAGCVPEKKARYSEDWQHLQDLVVGALATAMRKGELLHLQWQHVEYDEHGQPTALTVSELTSKTATRRTIPVFSKDLRKVLLRRRLGPDGKALGGDSYVFGNAVGERVKDLKRSWRNLCERVGADGLNFHDLRRECASRWFEAGMPLATVSRLLGHTSLETTFVYLGVDEARMPEEVRRFEEQRNGLEEVSQPALSGLSVPAKLETAVH